MSTITYNDHGEVRPILYRLSLAEMVVPYGAPESPHPRKFAFDSYVKFRGSGNDLILVLGVNMEWAPWPMSCPSVVIAWGKFTIWFVENLSFIQGLLISDTSNDLAWLVHCPRRKCIRHQERNLHPRGRRRSPLETHRLPTQWEVANREKEKARSQHGVHSRELR